MGTKGREVHRAVEKVLVSACLLGSRVRYDGSLRLQGHPVLERWVAEGRAVPLCPEVAVGFATPRPPAEIVASPDGATGEADGAAVVAGRARVLEVTGRDVTDLYLQAGRVALDAARRHGCRFAVLTDGSPSCGASFIYDGSFSGGTKPGQGSTAALLAAHGVRVFPEAAIEELDALLREPAGPRAG